MTTSSSSVTTTTILIVEDEVVVAENLRDILQREGYQVPEICVNGAEAIEQVKTLSPDLLLMDIRLKGSMDGIETVIAAEQIVQKQFTVIFLTAHSKRQFPHIAQVKSQYKYLTKPYSTHDLLQGIGELLNGKQ